MLVLSKSVCKKKQPDLFAPNGTYLKAKNVNSEHIRVINKNYM